RAHLQAVPMTASASPPVRTMVTDPVCGMTIAAEEAAATVTHGGQTYYFCAEGCARRFRENPAAYSAEVPAEKAAPAAPAAPAGVEYTCPMHPEVRQPGPGSCPKCGMALEPVAPAPTRARTQWTCPMHPQIVRDAPGSCPICGMALEPRTVSVDEGPDPELADMTRRFWIGLALTLPLLVFVMSDM